MTYYDQENQFLRQRLQKEIPILTALIQNLYQELDRKFHLNGAKIPVTFGDRFSGILYKAECS